MKIFLLQPIYVSGNNAFQSLSPIGDADWLGLWNFDCDSKQHTWAEKRTIVKVVNRAAPVGDFPDLTHGCLVVGSAAFAQIGPLLESCGELLPLSCMDGREYMLLDPYPCYDCVDEEKSEGRRFSGSGRFMYIEKFEFQSSLLPKAPIFKTCTYSAHVFGTSHFKDEVVSRRLKGLEFREVWNDDGGPVERIIPFDRVPRPD